MVNCEELSDGHDSVHAINGRNPKKNWKLSKEEYFYVDARAHRHTDAYNNNCIEITLGEWHSVQDVLTVNKALVGYFLHKRVNAYIQINILVCDVWHIHSRATDNQRTPIFSYSLRILKLFFVVILKTFPFAIDFWW